MSAFDLCRDLYDVALKPRLLLSLLKDQVPDETRPFRNPSHLSSIVSTLKFHHLLSENVPNNSADPKQLSSWNSAIDAWVVRVLSLTRSNSPDICWAGVCLLGVTVAECSSERFLASHSDWFNALLSYFQTSGASSQFVRVACGAALSDFFTRLAGFSNLKKDGNSYAGKLLLPVLKMFNEDGGEVMLDVAASLLSAILTHFPSSVHRYNEHVEGVLVSKLMDGNCTANSSKLAYCLAFLPKSKGDEESWSLMIQKILLSVSSLLNEALEGLEEESRRDEAVALLVPPGKDPPSSLGGCTMSGQALKNMLRSPEFLTLIISSLMQSCCTMLTSSYPVQVSLPVRPLLAIVRRLLMVNGSVPETLKPFTTSMQQEFVCSQLPILHLSALEVLVAVVNGLRSQLLPHAADIVRLLMGYLKKCWSPELRTKVYSTIRVILISVGCGTTLYIAEEIIQNGSTDLKVADSGTVGAVNEQPPIEVPLQRCQKKRKHGAAPEPPPQHHASFGSQVEAPRSSPALIALKVAALEALETLLNVGGAFKSDSWRRRIDHLLTEVATNACRGGLTYEEQPFLPKESRVTWEHFQLVALRALLASLLSPAGVRSPCLAQGLELFYKGKQHPGSKVAEFCAQALLALEVFVHPRALPLIDVSSSRGSSYYSTRTEFGGLKQNSYSLDDMLQRGYDNSHDVYDFLNDIYLEKGFGSEAPAAEVNNKVDDDNERLPDISRDQNVKISNSVQVSPEQVTFNNSDEGAKLANNDVQEAANGDRVTLDAQHHEEPRKESDKIPGVASEEFGKDIVDPDMSYTLNRASLPDRRHMMASKGIVSTTGAEGAVIAPSQATTSKKSFMEPDDVDSDDSFPDIEDGDPDTETDADSE